MQTIAMNVDSYIRKFPKPVQAILQKIRLTIRKATPQATEAMRYGIPTFQLHGNLVHFGGFTKHVSFFPGASPIRVFAKALKPYRTSKGTVQFLFNEKVPYGLITKMVKYRVKENLAKQHHTVFRRP